MAVKSVSIRIEAELLEKIARIAAIENRSINQQVLLLIKKCIQRYENRLG